MIIELDSIELDFICSGLSLLEKDFLDPKSARVEKIRKLRLYLEERYREGPDPLADLPALRSADEELNKLFRENPNLKRRKEE